jgi:hypothetical protein
MVNTPVTILFGHISVTLLRYTILISPQIVFNIEKLINIIYESITVVQINKYTGTH